MRVCGLAIQRGYNDGRPAASYSQVRESLTDPRIHPYSQSPIGAPRAYDDPPIDSETRRVLSRQDLPMGDQPARASLSLESAMAVYFTADCTWGIKGC
ncbi:hypothetical protein CIW48_27510 [Methylobacterium sp. P1-11]|nr:hypothetical protein CIW48_27510 [Methylobacterium sp. P1-11]